jgi:alpha-glucoside transport system permease protein
VLTGNRIIGLTIGSSDASSPWVATVLVLLIAAVCAFFGWLVAGAEAPSRRWIIGVVGGAIVGLVFALFFRRGGFPAMKAIHLVVWPVALAVVGAGLAVARKRPVAPAAVFGATLGWFVGAWTVPSFGNGTFAEAILGAVVLGAGVGASIAARPRASYVRQVAVEQRARAVIFLAPALAFISVSLVIPTIRTIYLSFFDKRSRAFIGLANYRSIVNDRSALDFRDWTGAFSSRLFILGALSIAVAAAAGMAYKRRSEGVTPPWLLAVGISGAVAAVAGVIARASVGDLRTEVPAAGGVVWLAVAATLVMVVSLIVQSVTHRGDTGLLSGGAGAPMAAGAVLFAFALFAYLRGTVMNNLWWVFVVTTFATVLGLAISVLADRGKHENVAKSIIFMPMAISFVGAGIIWRFVFIARPPGENQTGMLNAMWVGLGSLSQSTWPRWVALLLLGVIIALLGIVGLRALRVRADGVLAGVGVTMAMIVWIAVLLLGRTLGGIEQAIADRCCAATILFVQEPPFNNVWLMVVLIWIQTGFTMVIFSAAIKAVPAELVEASRVDGATESQSFWRVVIPQIAPTIGVVTTTLIVLVTKVFDIVKVMTGGNFGTQVIANLMYDEAFKNFNLGLGSALAVVLFAAILPVMFVNVRRMQKEAR